MVTFGNLPRATQSLQEKERSPAAKEDYTVHVGSSQTPLSDISIECFDVGNMSRVQEKLTLSCLTNPSPRFNLLGR